MAGIPGSEVVALARILPKLDYYQLLHLKREASPSEVREAYHAASRSFHPDANRKQEAEIRAAVEDIARRVSEAYSVLRNPRRRQAYDHQLSEGEGLRMQLAEASAAAQRKSTEEREGRTPQGRQFFNLACRDIERDDLEAAARNLKTALTFEPDSEFFKKRLSEIRVKLGYVR